MVMHGVRPRLVARAASKELVDVGREMEFLVRQPRWQVCGRVPQSAGSTKIVRLGSAV